MSFAGEELGLLGSAEWSRIRRSARQGRRHAQHGYDRPHQDDKVYIGASAPAPRSRPRSSRLPRSLDSDRVFGSGYSSSDHTSFVTKRKFRCCFSSPACTPIITSFRHLEKIDPVAATRLLAVVGMTGELLAMRRSVRIHRGRRRQPAGGSGGSATAVLRIDPDFGQVETGVKFSDVKPGSPAAKAA